MAVLHHNYYVATSEYYNQLLSRYLSDQQRSDLRRFQRFCFVGKHYLYVFHAGGSVRLIARDEEEGWRYVTGKRCCIEAESSPHSSIYAARILAKLFFLLADEDGFLAIANHEGRSG